MGQEQPDYFNVFAWDESLTIDERVDRARFSATLAGAAFNQVKSHAVSVLLADGLTVRAIAERIGISKSEVGRISRRLMIFDPRETGDFSRKWPSFSEGANKLTR